MEKKVIVEAESSRRGEPRRVKKRPARRRKLWLAVTAAVLLLAVLVSVLWDPNDFDGLRRRFIYAKARKNEMGCAELYGYTGDPNSRFAALDGSLLIVSPGRIRLIGEDGQVRYEQKVHLESASIAQGGQVAAVYDIGGTELYVLGSRGLLRRMDAEGDILSAAVNDKGYLAVTVHKSGYKAAVCVYDDKGEPVFTFNSADHFVMTAALSQNSRCVSAAALGQAEGMFADHLITYRLNSTEPAGSCDITGTVVLEMDAVGRRFCAVAENGLYFIDNAGALREQYDFGGDVLSRCSLDGDGFAALLLSRYRSGGQCRLVTVDSWGQEIAQLTVGSDVTDISAAGRYIAVLYSDHMTVYDKRLRECATLEDVSTTRSVMMRRDGSVVLAGASAASLYLP